MDSPNGSGSNLSRFLCFPKCHFRLSRNFLSPLNSTLKQAAYQDGLETTLTIQPWLSAFLPPARECERPLSFTTCVGKLKEVLGRLSEMTTTRPRGRTSIVNECIGGDNRREPRAPEAHI